MKRGKGSRRRLRPLPVLRTRRLVLRRTRLRDHVAIFRHCSDPRVTRYLTFETHRSPADTRKFLRASGKAYQRGGPPGWAITLRKSGALVGHCGFLPVERKHRRGEFGYWVGRAYWGQGYATEAVEALLDYGFRRLKLNRLQARVVVGNHASARVLEKAGLRYEGTLRQFDRIKGNFPDLQIYSMLQREFARRRR